jgi:ABC-type glycerol-3-phosphate transport system substrate-binding protein
METNEVDGLAKKSEFSFRKKLFEIQKRGNVIMSKKFFIALLVFSVLAMLTACAGDEQTDAAPKKDPAEASDSGGDETPETKNERFEPNLPEIDFGGYEFRALVPTNNAYGSYTFDVEEENGDNLNDAIYKRNRYIEEKYNVVLTQTEISDFWPLIDMFKKCVTSGSDDFDVSTQNRSLNLVTQGYCLFPDDLPYIDMAQPWYAHDLNETYRIGNKYFIAYSDECMSVYDAVIALCFNKALTRDLGLENPYELVKNGNWTHDKFFDMCRAAVSDLDGDGTMTDTDRYGILSQFDEFLGNFWVASGIKTIGKDSDDMLALNLAGNELLLEILEKTRQNVYGDKKIFFDTYKDKVTSFQSDLVDVSHKQFENNLGLFLTAKMVRIPYLRTMEADFGIVPFPKYDESQNRYYAAINGAWPKIVPNTAPNPERTSVILEALAAESKNLTIPAFTEICLKTKYARDEESQEMLTIILNSVTEDLGTTIFWDSVKDGLISEVMGKGNFVSVIEKRSAAWEKLLNEMNGAVDGLD